MLLKAEGANFRHTHVYIFLPEVSDINQTLASWCLRQVSSVWFVGVR